ncbi:MAG TPA: Fic family protein [Chthoniobacteraceae bacterium]|nr:Fic family protein [Chthoniobacteraceae bacterium]
MLIEPRRTAVYCLKMSRISELWQRIDDAKALLDSLRPLKCEQEERAMQKFRLWWTYHSNAIEGNSLTQGETETFLMEGLTAKGKPLKDHLDLRGHSNAINYLLGLVRDQEVLTEAAIRKLHEILLIEPYRVQAITPDGLPTMKTIGIGCYKSQPNHVRTPTGETHFYATPEETPAKMHDLMTWYRVELKRGMMHRVEIAARYHHRFTAIHPFDDGNGRMSRLLMNLILMQAGYPPAVIRIGERSQYLAALRRADADEEEDFLELIGAHVVESLTLFAQAARGEEIREPSGGKM